jgi:hypothetical protein
MVDESAGALEATETRAPALAAELNLSRYQLLRALRTTMGIPRGTGIGPT